MKRNYLIRLIALFVLQLILTEPLLSQQPGTVINLPLSTDTIKASIVKENLLVNSLEGEFGALQSDIQVAMSGNGTYAFCWFDNRDGEKSIYYQFYNRFGNKISTNFKIESYDQIADTPPTIAANQNGTFVIVYAQTNGLIVAQKFNSYAEKIGMSYLNGSTPNQITNLSVAINSDNSFVVVWNSRTNNGTYLINAQFVHPNGVVWYDDLHTLNSSGITNNSLFKNNSIAIDENGNYLITWLSFISDSSFINLRILNSSGEITGQIICIDSLLNPVLSQASQIAYLKNGIFLLVWQQTTSISPGFFNYRLVNSSGEFITGKLQSTQHSYPVDLFSISSDHQNNFYVGYSMQDNDYVQRITLTGGLYTGPILLNYSSDFFLQRVNKDFSDFYNNNFIVATEYYLLPDINVGYCQLNSEIINLKALSKISDDISQANQEKSDLHINSFGSSIVVWQDERNGKKELYAQVFDKNLNPVGNNIQITDSVNDYYNYDNIMIDSYKDGTFLIGFAAYNNYSSSSLILQQITLGAQLIMNNKFITNLSSSFVRKSTLKINSIDEVLVSWYSEYDVSYNIFNKSLTTLRNTKSIKHSQNNLIFNPITVSVDSSFNIFVAWRNYDNINYHFEDDLYGEFYNRKGEVTKEPFIIDELLYYSPTLFGINNALEFVVMYENFSGGLNILRSYQPEDPIYYINKIPYSGYSNTDFKILKFENQKVLITYPHASSLFSIYFDDTARKNKLFLLSNPQNQNFYYSNASYGIDFLNNKILLSSDCALNSLTGLDVYTSEIMIDNLNFNKSHFYMPVDSDFLYNNFPNPFNPKTKIVYELLAYHRVKLSVYNILGQEVKVLVDQNQEQGLYEVDFDATGLASGIYFYRLEAFNTSIKKMIYLK